MTGSYNYVPPKVWTWNKGSGGSPVTSLNRPIAGATHEKELPVGRHPLQLYSLGTPNGQKVTILLEELLALGHSGADQDRRRRPVRQRVRGSEPELEDTRLVGPLQP
jgi:GST-like protein